MPDTHVPGAFRRWWNNMFAETGGATTADIDTAVTGLYDDRGNYDASVNTFPAAGGSGTAGAVKKGDVWVITVAGTLGGEAVFVGDNVRALADTPGQTAGNWAIVHNQVAQNVIVRTDVPNDLAFQVEGKPGVGAVIFRHVTARAFTLAAAGHVAKAAAAATAQTDFIVAVNGVTKATLRFAAAGDTITIVGGTSAALAAADIVTVTAPNPQDATLENVSFTLKAELI